MYTGLQQKPFYFITDRDTYYQFFVDNTENKSPKKYVYYPQEYENMSAKKIDLYKQSIVKSFIFWSVTNSSKLILQDAKTVKSLIIDGFGTIAICVLCARMLRKTLFRIQLPVVEIKLQRLGFNIRRTKALIAYSTFSYLAYKTIKTELKSTYLQDLAFEYKYNFAEKMHSSCDQIFNKLSESRFVKLRQQEL